MAWKHGRGGYTNHKCRCGECRKAWSVYCLELRRRRTARGVCVDCLRPARDDEEAALQYQRLEAQIAALASRPTIINVAMPPIQIGETKAEFHHHAPNGSKDVKLIRGEDGAVEGARVEDQP